MSADPKLMTDQQKFSERVLKDLQREVGGELLRTPGDRLALRHPPTPPKPQRS